MRRSPAPAKRIPADEHLPTRMDARPLGRCAPRGRLASWAGAGRSAGHRALLWFCFWFVAVAGAKARDWTFLRSLLVAGGERGAGPGGICHLPAEGGAGPAVGGFSCM